jgi:uncharacterized repeat protein (TIGR02543 family)
MDVTGKSGRYVRLTFQNRADLPWMWLSEVSFISTFVPPPTPINLSTATGVFLADTAAGGDGTLANTSWAGPNSYYDGDGLGFSVLTDGTSGTKWLGCGTETFGDSYPGPGNIPGPDGHGAGFYFTLPTAVTMQSIQLFTEDSAPPRSPATMTIEGSNAGDPMLGASWTSLYSGPAGLQDIGPYSAGAVVSFANTTAYTSYRVLFPTIYGNPYQGAQLADIVVRGFANYTVTYNGNGNTAGTAPVDPSSPYLNNTTETVTVLGQGDLVKTGYTFEGWNTLADGTGTSYAAAAPLTITADTILYAQWAVIATYALTYDGNGNTSGTAPVDSSSPYLSGITVTVLGQGDLVKTGLTFTHWNTAANGAGTHYTPGATFPITADTILYAQWANTAPGSESIANGSFETGREIPLNWNEGAGGYAAVDLSAGPSNTDLPWWSGSYTQWYDINSAEGRSAQGVGERFINLIRESDTNKLVQTFGVVAGTSYTVSYYEQDRGVSGLMDVTLGVTDGSVTGTTSQTVDGTGDWVQYGFTFTPDTTTTATLSFENGYTPDLRGDGDGVFLDSVSVQVTTYYTMTYNGNSSDNDLDAPVDPSSPYPSGTTVTVLDQGALVKTGFTFDGWNTQADGLGTSYAAAAPLTITADTILYAKWTLIAGSNYASWAATNITAIDPLADATPAGDADNDGLSNLMEYALGKNPLASSQPAGEMTGKLITFTKGDEAVANGDVTYSIETSTNLLNEVTTGDGGWAPVAPDVDDATTISYTLPDAVPGGKVFARLVVTPN